MGSVYPGVSNGDKINKLIRGNKRVVMADRRGGGGGGRGGPLYPGTPPPQHYQVMACDMLICSGQLYCSAKPKGFNFSLDK